ncbi:MAG: PTS system, N-acetylglucosamine-specific IIA component (EC / PTS system, N-acetylglucosamine-specific IIB component (EC / PTS system, N-acetylglucosamine-specific IIC component (EC [uncultured Sulfurovum sp.]|uniref:PTS system, N-acetylglucosamine-specific IIA component )) n=1 Tax=uncultured Sulfurovum sp. TaxID=269237 RepID=A0A6S6T713_9BACT|nr:MAG: PTS system, N-acetylglucosamine-specific IIA component (EC / PTS system, N-acetylglucosamine-specific IIB component (EC / PTS system, N-acetylglucosamine-specific IIC component (EC [uncultured Sulfurovum sp.]
MFNLFQKVGKALMTPIAVLPVAALLLRLGFGDISFIDAQVADIMKSAGDAIFSHLDLLFGIGIAYGLAKNNDGAAALAGALGVLIAKAVYMSIDKDVNMGVFVGIIIGILAGTLYNRYHTIKLPEFLGFFGGKRFVPIITSLAAIAVGVLAGYFWHFAQSGIDAFSNAIIGLEEVGTFIYGTLNRLLIPLGLHHILNSVFWFQLGEFTHIKDGVEVVANGDLHRFFAGDKTAGVYMSGFYVVMMFGLPAMALAIYLTTPKTQRKKAGAILAGVAFTSFLTGITEPLEFLFLFVAPLLFVLHALLTGLALALAQMLDIHAGFGFSAGFIDYVINYKLATNPALLLPLGLLFSFIYFMSAYYTIKLLKLRIFDEEKTQDNTLTQSNEALAFITALGGKDNIVNTDACITRLRMSVKDSTILKDEAFTTLGAKGVIRPNETTIQVVLGTKAEGIAEKIKEYIN